MHGASGPYLVLGGSGQVGFALRQVASERGIQTEGTYFTHPQPGLRPWDGSFEDLEALLESVQPSTVIHAAGWTDVEACEADEDRARQVNGTLPGTIAARLRGRAHYVFYSTEYVFDGTAGPYGEDDPTNPLSAYGRSKLEGEHRVLDANPDALIIRTTVVYGPDPNAKNFVAQLWLRLGAGETMRIPADQCSSPTFNLDLARATLDLLDRDQHGIWHVAGPEVMDRYAFARTVCSAFGLDPHLLEPVPTAVLNQRAPRPLAAGLRIDRLRAMLGTDCMQAPASALTAYARIAD